MALQLMTPGIYTIPSEASIRAPFLFIQLAVEIWDDDKWTPQFFM